MAIHEYAPPRGSTTERLSALFTGVRADIRIYLQRREIRHRTYRELARLSDRDLSDIGFARCDIPEIARMKAENDVPNRKQSA